MTIRVEKAASRVIALQVLYVVVVCITDIIKESLCAYVADDMPHFKTVVVFDCRGVEPTDFEPRVCSFSVLYIINKSSAVAEMRDRGHTRHSRKEGGLLCPFRRGEGAGSPSNTMWHGPMSTSVPSGVFIHPAICPQ